jgi:ubiquinone/menaquinone biosynthesis C-methylase UbiE
LESLRLARLVQPGGRVIGIDKCAAFIKEAQARAAQEKLAAEFQVADAETLPFADATFDVARAERVLVYLPDPKRALGEMRRVTRPGGAVTAIEPDFGTIASTSMTAPSCAACSTMNATPTFRMAGSCATCAD